MTRRLRYSAAPSLRACVDPDARERGAATGSKIKVTSIIHMAWELAALLLAYQVGPAVNWQPLVASSLMGCFGVAVSPLR